MIEAIIFDLGGVILKHDKDLVGNILSKLFSISKDQGIKIWDEYKLKLLTDEFSWEEFMKELKQKIGSDKSPEDLTKIEADLYKENAQIDDQVLGFIDQLKKKYKVYLLTDTIDIHDKYNQTRDIYERFDEVFKSYEEGVSKVEGRKIFLNALQKINISPENCVYIDDVEKYVEEARNLGLKGIVFSNLEQLKKELKDFDVIW